LRGSIVLSFGTNQLNRADVLKQAFGSKRFLLVTVFTAIAYLLFSEFLDLFTGVPAMASATYFALYYPLIALSAVLMGLNAYSFRRVSAKSGPGSGVAVGSTGSTTSVVGSLVSCSCHTSLLLPALTFLGVGALSGIGIIEALVEYQLWIITSFILLDLYLVYRLLGKAKAMEIAPR